MDNTLGQLYDILKQNGLNIEDAPKEGAESYNYLMDLDSIQYISVIADVEKNFQVEIPDEYLDKEKVGSVEEFARIIDNIKSQQ